MNFVIAYIAAAVTFGVLDGIWLRLTSGPLYRAQLGDLLAPQVQIAPAILFYLIYVAGIVYFPVRAAFETGAWRDAIVPAIMLGLVAYATYDLTNHATMRIWSVWVTAADIAWGIVATTVTAVVTVWISTRVAG